MDVALAEGQFASLDSLPPELIASQQVEAERDADRVGEYLAAFYAACGVPPPWESASADGRCPYSAFFLLELAAALRLQEWEFQGLVKPFMGLPKADEAVRGVLLNAASPDRKLTLTRLIARTHMTHFSWLGVPLMGADIVLSPANEEQLAEAIATYLWNNRKRIRESPHNEIQT